MELNLIDIEECEDVLASELEEMVKLGEDMIQFCVSKGGMGLAAPQIGINKKIIVWAHKSNIFQIGFNPFYIKNENKRIQTVEGCLSFPNENYYLQRYKYIRGLYFVPNKTKDELIKLARNMRDEESIVFQHEVDHLFGKTIKSVGKKIE